MGNRSSPATALDPAAFRLQSVLTPYQDQAVLGLIRALDAELAALYGSGDREPVEDDDFTPPGGLFLLGYHDTRPVACGAYRLREDIGHGQRDAEIKRMYVAPTVRRYGYARLLLTALEASARQAGATRAILETGILSREAVALYTTLGYENIPPYSDTYADSPTNRGFARNL